MSLGWEFNILEHVKAFGHPDNEYQSCLNMLPERPERKPDRDGYFWFVVLHACELQLRRPDGSETDVMQLDEGDVFRTRYPIVRRMDSPLCPMANHEVAQLRGLAIRTARAFHQVRKVTGSVA